MSAELRAVEKQAAEETGQWTEKQVPLGSAAVRTSITIRFITPGPPDDLGRYIPLDSPHQVKKLIEAKVGVPSNEPTGPGYHYDKSDQLVLESKEDMERRGLASPDDGDALALTFAAAVPPKRPAYQPPPPSGDRSWMR